MEILIHLYILSVVLSLGCWAWLTRKDLCKGIDFTVLDLVVAFFCCFTPILNFVVIGFALEEFLSSSNLNKTLIKGKSRTKKGD